MATIAVLGTFDSKGLEHAFVADALRRAGFATLLIDVGCLDAPTVTPDIPRAEVLAALGEDSSAILARRDRGECVALMARAAARCVARLAKEGKIHGIISLGGGGGTAIATTAMRSLPLGFPKVMVSTLASGNTAPYVGTSDIVMIPAIVDVAGINRVSRPIFENAAGAIGGMVTAAENRRALPAADRPLVVASMFGNTTACVNEARRLVEAAGYEVLVFHATGTGGRSMEALIASGLVAGVLDITTTEWADELVGGVMSAGPERMARRHRHGQNSRHRRSRMPRHGELRRARNRAVEILRPHFLSSQPAGDADAYLPGRMRATRPHPGGENQPVHGTGDRAVAACRHQRHQRTWPAVS